MDLATSSAIKLICVISILSLEDNCILLFINTNNINNKNFLILNLLIFSYFVQRQIAMKDSVLLFYFPSPNIT